jgi:hypothetical protein
LLLCKPIPTPTQNQPSMLPSSHLEPSLNVQPSFISSPLSNNLQKRPRHFGGSKVSALAEISVFMCIK